MNIIIFRHGEPAGIPNERITMSGLKSWITQYNSAQLKTESHPDKQALEIASEAELLFTSDLVRSKDSAIRLATGQLIQENPLFREAGLPYSYRGVIKVKPQTWVALFRVLWYLGYSSGCESKSAVQTRSRKAAIELIASARKHQTVLLAGHGIFNRFLVKELLLHGFTGPRYPNSNYWGFSIYEQD